MTDNGIQLNSGMDGGHNIPSVSQIVDFVADVRNEVESRRRVSHVIDVTSVAEAMYLRKSPDWITKLRL